MYQDMDNIHMYGPSIYSKEVHSNRFWEDTFKVYEPFRYKVKPESSEEALAESLSLNRNIKVGKKCILFKSWLEKGIYCIGHLIDEEGRFYKYNEFTTTTTKNYYIQVNYLEYFGCVQAIKTYIKSLKIITESNEMAINPISLAKIYNQVKGTKCYSDILIENGKSPNCCSKWEIKLREGIDWKACFKKENIRSKTEIVPDQIITQDSSNQYCVKRNGHCTRCFVQFL